MIAPITLNDPSPHVKARGRKCRVKTLAFDTYLVTPPEEGKLKRTVHFDVSEAGTVRIECVAMETGEVCEANAFAKMCSHVEAATRRLEQNIKKEQARQDKALKDLQRSKLISKEVKKHPSQKELL